MGDSIVTAAILIIGNEVLSGRTRDANLHYLTGELNAMGIRVLEAQVIPDDEDVIAAAVNRCRAAYTYVFTTGGIGSTHDDITARSVAKAFGLKFIRHPEAEQILVAHYGDDLNAARLRMADMPEGALLIDNPVSRAPGFRIENVHVLAGVPVIAKAMFEGLKGELKGGRKLLARTVHTDMTEGMLALELEALQSHHRGVEIGSYPFFRTGKFGINLVVRGEDLAQIEAAVADLKAMIEGLGGTASDGEAHVGEADRQALE